MALEMEDFCGEIAQNVAVVAGEGFDESRRKKHAKFFFADSLFPDCETEPVHVVGEV